MLIVSGICDVLHLLILGFNILLFNTKVDYLFIINLNDMLIFNLVYQVQSAFEVPALPRSDCFCAFLRSIVGPFNNQLRILVSRV